MARNNKRMKEMSISDKVILYSGIGVVVLAIIVTALFLYSKSLNDEVKNSTMTLEEMANIANNTIGNTQSASTEMGKSVEEAENEINTTNNANVSNNINTTNNMSSKNTASQTNNIIANSTTETNAKKEEEVIRKELEFIKPVEGDMVREYAKDNLIYSETLQEWTTHTGIDIKADKTTVVKAAEAGTIKSIKNDPRYGLTIVIEHDSQYQSIYSNLLTSEFVVEGEKVEKGQSIGTVGNTAVFEIADEPHLHFEIWKDSLPVDPTTAIKK